MISASPIEALSTNSFDASPTKIRRASKSQESVVFTDIYQEETNIAIWQRELSASLGDYLSSFLASNHTFQTAMSVTPQNALSSINEAFGTSNFPELSENITELVEMFCCLFGLERVGLRLKTLNHAMCPKFHVDKVPCRLITTYQGVATEWLSHQAVNRENLNIRNDDLQTGVLKKDHDIQQLSCGDVALLKGELWEGNENAGLVHRSPTILPRENRLLLTLDFIS